MAQYLLLVYIFFSFVAVHAQSLTGQILSLAGEPIPYSTIGILNADFALINGTIADEGGHYQLELKKGTYILKINSVGFLDTLRSVQVEGNMTFDIQVKSAIFRLDEVVVEGFKTSVVQMIDKKVINVGVTY